MSSPLSTATPSSRWLLPVLALLSAVAPLATDMYLPSLPRMAHDLGTSASGIQLTLTAFLAGVASGQLVIGPLSDGLGRRRPLLLGTVLCLLASIACALSNGVEMLVAARFLQGFSGGAGVVLARAIIADTSSGATAAKRMSLMMVIGGLAPVLAPVIGGLVANLGGWRTVMWVIVGLVTLMWLGVQLVVGETLPVEARHGGGLRGVLGNAGKVLGNRRYVGYALTMVFAFAAMFSYIAASPFVLQNVLGLSQTHYAVIFGCNAFGLMLGNIVNVRLAGKVAPRRLLAIGVSGLLLMTLVLFALTLSGMPRWPSLIALWLVMPCLGLSYGNAVALALAQVREYAGAGSAFIGTFQFLGGALVAPVVGLAGDRDPRPMVVMMLLLASLAAVSLFRTIRTPAG